MTEKDRPFVGIDVTAALTQGGGIGRYTRELVRALVDHDDGYDYPDALIAPGAALYRAIIDAHLAAEEGGGDGRD